MSDTTPPIWSAGAEPVLLASRDRATGEIVFPPLPQASPLAPRHEPATIAPEGVVYSLTVVHPNPKSGLPPFALGYVDLPGPVRVFGRIGGAPRIGARCRARPHAELGYVFETVSGEHA
jgi:uncharacterized OB-fold protein